MTRALIAAVTNVESQFAALAAAGAGDQVLWGFQLGYRTALLSAGKLGDLEDQILERHFANVIRQDYGGGEPPPGTTPQVSRNDQDLPAADHVGTSSALDRIPCRDRSPASGQRKVSD